jgi:hypothetical protein
MREGQIGHLPLAARFLDYRRHARARANGVIRFTWHIWQKTRFHEEAFKEAGEAK